MEWLSAIRTAIDYMEKHLADDISAQDVADQVVIVPIDSQSRAYGDGIVPSKRDILPGYAGRFGYARMHDGEQSGVAACRHQSGAASKGSPASQHAGTHHAFASGDHQHPAEIAFMRIWLPLGEPVFYQFVRDGLHYLSSLKYGSPRLAGG